jgi:hypothetical protein
MRTQEKNTLLIFKVEISNSRFTSQFFDQKWKHSKSEQILFNQKLYRVAQKNLAHFCEQKFAWSPSSFFAFNVLFEFFGGQFVVFVSSIAR